jgi:hypothetical protein
MNFNNISVGSKLWAIVLGLMVSMLGLAAAIQFYITQIAMESARLVQSAEERIVLATRRGMTELTTERVLLSMTVPDERQRPICKPKVKTNIAAIAEVQNKSSRAYSLAPTKSILIASNHSRHHYELTLQMQSSAPLATRGHATFGKSVSPRFWMPT